MKKDITFFCTDINEYYTLLPISAEAKNRGYCIRFATDMEQKCEIGFYCQHLGYIKNKNCAFSFIMLHDLAQGHDRWPRYWDAEPWADFDIGILPGKQWEDLWHENSSLPQANPRIGVFSFGWPKADSMQNNKSYYNPDRPDKYNLKYNKTLLYAPSWEYGGRQSKLTEITSKLEVNLLLKQPPKVQGDENFIKWYQSLINEENRKVNNMSCDHYRIVNQNENIMNLIPLADLVISEESSVLYEGLMMGVPVLAVKDWLVPDKTPPRLPVVPLENIEKCNEAELSAKIPEILSKPVNRDELANNLGISNLGKSSGLIVDLLECCINENNMDPILSQRLMPHGKEQMRVNFKQLKRVKEKNISYKTSKINMLMSWVIKNTENNNTAIQAIFIANNWKKVGIIGVSSLTQLLCYELEGIDSDVLCIIDEKGLSSIPVIFRGLTIKRYTIQETLSSSILHEADVMIIIEDSFVNEMYEVYAKSYKIPVVPLSDILR